MRTHVHQASFAGGEVSPLLYGRFDNARLQIAVASAVNFLLLAEGPAVARPGFGYLGNAKSHSVKGALFPFVRSRLDSYALELGQNVMRFWTNGGLLQSGGSPLELATPWPAADLWTADGRPALRHAQSADRQWFATRKHAPRLLERRGAVDWSLAEFKPDDGPWSDENADAALTVYASGATGSVTLTASKGLFQAGHVGALFKLRLSDLASYGAWEVGKSVSANAYLRSDGRVYQAANSATTGSIRPTHERGEATDGQSGVRWRYVHAGEGWARITAVSVPGPLTVTGTASGSGGKVRLEIAGHGLTTGFRGTVAGLGGTVEGNGAWPLTVIDADHVDLDGSVYANAWTSGGTLQVTHVLAATATVLAELPTLVVGSGNATSRWWFGAWSTVAEFPAVVGFGFERLVFARGPYLWFSRTDDFFSFAPTRAGTVYADSAITVRLTGEVNEILWLLETASGLVVGTDAGEFLVRRQSEGAVFGAVTDGVRNFRADRQTRYGSVGAPALAAHDRAVFAVRTGRAIRDAGYSFEKDRLQAASLSLLAAHLLKAGVVDLAWQGEPDSLLWVLLADGSLRVCTFLPEQELVGWSRVTTAGTVEAICAKPSDDGTGDELVAIIARDVGGTKRYVERLAPRWQLADARTSAAFSDSFLSYSGAATATLSGLGHLEGKEVLILADGAAHPRRTVTSGQVTLSRTCTSARAGLPYTWRLEQLDAELLAGPEPLAGRVRRVSEIVTRVLETASLKVGILGSALVSIIKRSASTPMGDPEPLTSGLVAQSVNGKWGTGARGVFEGEGPLPATVAGAVRRLDVGDR